MTKKEKVRLWIPASLAYGDKPTRPGAPSGPLVFDIELVDF
jgi:FKBP-type peptidyl-prolyl cis-trans isomerase